MKVSISEVISEYFAGRSSTFRYNLAVGFRDAHPEVKYLIEGNKRPRRHVTNQHDLDLLTGYLKAKGGTKSSLPVAASTLAAHPTQGKELVASLVRNVKQLRAAGYEINISVREPAKEF